MHPYVQIYSFVLFEKYSALSFEKLRQPDPKPKEPKPNPKPQH